MHSEFGNYLQDADSKALSRIDEILARSRKVVEESIELSKKNIEHKPRLEIILDTPKNTPDLNSSHKKTQRKLSESSQEAEFDNIAETSHEKSIDDLSEKIHFLQKKAAADEIQIENLKQKIQTIKLSKSNNELIQADEIIKNLKNTLATGLHEENKKLKQDLERLLKKKSVEEIKLSKELDDVIKERKILEVQYNNLKYLFDQSPSYSEELQDAKIELERVEQQSIDTIKLLEIRIQEQENENFKMREALKNTDFEDLNIIKVRFEDQAKQNYKFLKKLKTNN